VPCAPLLTVPEVLAEPQTHALGMLEKGPETGVPLMNLPLSIDGRRPELRRRPPRLGEHNEEILTGDRGGAGTRDRGVRNGVALPDDGGAQTEGHPVS
jgi:crotonobetainyl-CoA:carnitine CoA-transferase CaiB-like acyl-CoA transferase